MDLDVIFRSKWMGVLYAAVDQLCTFDEDYTRRMPTVCLETNLTPHGMAGAAIDCRAKAAAWCLWPEKCEGADAVVLAPVCRFVRSLSSPVTKTTTLVLDLDAVKVRANAMIAAAKNPPCRLKVDWAVVQAPQGYCAKCDKFRFVHDSAKDDRYPCYVEAVTCPSAPPCTCPCPSPCPSSDAREAHCGSFVVAAATTDHPATETCPLCMPLCLDVALGKALWRGKARTGTGMSVALNEMRARGRTAYGYVTASQAQKAALLAWWRFFDTLHTVEYSFDGDKDDTPFTVFADPADPARPDMKHLFIGTDWGVHCEHFVMDVCFRPRADAAANHSQCVAVRDRDKTRMEEDDDDAYPADVLDLYILDMAKSAAARMPWLVEHLRASAGLGPVIDPSLP